MGRIFYACFAHDEPMGGIKVIYRHVDLLNRAGLSAYVFHPRERFRVTWFENATPIVGPRALASKFDPEHDILVLPEDLVVQPSARPLVDAPGAKVIFNQGVYNGFAMMGLDAPVDSPYLRPDVRAVFCVSDHNAAVLRHAYPAVPVHRIRLGVDTARFTYRPIRKKRPQIAAAMKAPVSMLAIRQVLAARGRLADHDWRFLERLTEREMSTTLADSLVTIFCGIEEGFGLVPLEAMLAGSIVAAFAGGPADEYLPARYRFAPGDIVGVVRFIERVCKLARDEPATLERWTRQALAKAATYSLAAEERSVLAAWSQVLGAPVTPPPPRSKSKPKSKRRARTRT